MFLNYAIKRGEGSGGAGCVPRCCARSYGHSEITGEGKVVKFVSICNYVILNVPCEVAVDWEDGKNEFVHLSVIYYLIFHLTRTKNQSKKVCMIGFQKCF